MLYPVLHSTVILITPKLCLLCLTNSSPSLLQLLRPQHCSLQTITTIHGFYSQHQPIPKPQPQITQSATQTKATITSLPWPCLNHIFQTCIIKFPKSPHHPITATIMLQAPKHPCPLHAPTPTQPTIEITAQLGIKLHLCR
jgi:hypothetical protein